MSLISAAQAPEAQSAKHPMVFRLLRGAIRPVTARTALSKDELQAEPRIFQLDARFERAGAWAGVAQLVEQAYLGLLERGADQIIEEHLLELHAALPEYRHILRPKHLSLTETVGADERTRFYALDHAYRLVHGLVGIVLQWRRLLAVQHRWVVIVRNFDDAEHLGKRFFVELARRSAPKDGIDVVIETLADGPDATHLTGVPAPHWVKALRVPPVPALTIGEADLGTIEDQVAQGEDVLFERKYPVLLAHYRAAGDSLAVTRTAARIFLIYSSYGYYHEARRFMSEIRARFDGLVEGDEAKRLHYAGRMNLCLVLTGDADGGLRIVSELAAAYVTKPYVLAGMSYILGMHHLRYAQAKDIQKAERYILQAVSDIQEAKDQLSPTAYAFRKVFIDNGLAFVRARQGRHREALDLCEAGYEFLTNQMGEDRHLLHRSVLQYNIAQVHVMLGRLDEGLEHYRKAMRMDPNYSEYNNEVGNILQEQSYYRQAIQHYEQAIRTSAPYPEVYFNKAVCHARLDELDEALTCFDISLELDPDQPERRALRADVLRELGRVDEALEGYDTAIALGYDSTAVRVNRAVLHYNKGSYDLALHDMDRAIDVEANQAAHYENRAAIYQAMHQEDLYERDIAMADRCRELA
jgi:tetratricopeptide (TPR) repeat protein